MEAFKKWRKEETYSELWSSEKHEGAELAWRAALEWLQSEEEKSQHYITGDLMRQELEGLDAKEKTCR